MADGRLPVEQTYMYTCNIIHNEQGKNSLNPYTVDFMETGESNHTVYTIGGDVPMLYENK